MRADTSMPRDWLIRSLVVAILMTMAARVLAETPLDQAIRLQSDGRNREAQTALRGLLPQLRAANNQTDLARALTALTDASLAVGDYESAIRDAQDAFDAHDRAGQRSESAWDLN